MVSIPTWVRYFVSKLDFSVSLAEKAYESGIIRRKDMTTYALKHMLMGKLTYLHWSKGDAMIPAIGSEGANLVVRKFIDADPNQVSVGDVVVLMNPENPKNHLVRRLAAVEGYKMMSKYEKDEPFVLEKDQFWVLADNQGLNPKEATDSRTFGPVNMVNILGRAIYCFQNAADHGPLQNSYRSMRMDFPVLQVELDINLLKKNHKR